MSVHRVRLVYSEGGGESFNGWLETWLTNMAPWSERENTVPARRDAELVDTPHYRGNLTFQWTEDKSIIMDQLWGYLTAYCDWALLGYHVCTHDEDNPQPCEWGTVKTNGSVPGGVSL
jgi:hypothetical protein